MNSVSNEKKIVVTKKKNQTLWHQSDMITFKNKLFKYQISPVSEVTDEVGVVHFKILYSNIRSKIFVRPKRTRNDVIYKLIHLNIYFT